MIARRWRVWTDPGRADALEPYLRRTGMGDALDVPGNRGALLLRGEARREEVEFVLLTFWDSVEAVRAFAGDDLERAVLYPEDHAFFTRWDERVEHLRVAGQHAVFG